VHEWDSHVHRMIMTLYGFFPIARDLYSIIEELTCMDLYIYGDVILSTIFPKQLMILCSLIFHIMMTWRRMYLGIFLLF
jgi:hypothetical protein